MRLIFFLVLLIFVNTALFADLAPVEFRESDGSPSTFPSVVNVSNTTLTDNGDGTITLANLGGNSFETISVPAGTNPVADSATDTLTVTDTGPVVVTGTAGTDTIDIDVTTSPASSATVVGTGRTLTGGTGIDAMGDLSADRTITFLSTEVEATTWGAGGNASNVWMKGLTS